MLLTINKMKRQHMEPEKIFVNDGTDKRLISKIQKSSHNSISKKQTTQSKYGAENLNRHFSKDKEMTNSHMKRRSTSLMTKEKQI